jgi:S-formylglutathione hydrolase FrmB
MKRHRLAVVLGTLAAAAGFVLASQAFVLDRARAASAPPRVESSSRIEVAQPDFAGRVEERTFLSLALGRTMAYSVYLPPGYSTLHGERYPVLYLLHGRGDSRLTWGELGLRAEADRLIATGALAPFIIVMPDGESGYWMDHAAGGPRWGTYAAGDLVDEVDRVLPTIRDRRARAIGGFSMGGHGALQLAVNNPETFSIVGAHSLALRSEATALPFFGKGADFQARDPVSLCASRPGVAHSLRLWIDIGADDPWRVAAARFHDQLASSGVEHRWTMWPGRHDHAYTREHMAAYLTFYGTSLEASDPRGALAVQLPATFDIPRGYDTAE